MQKPVKPELEMPPRIDASPEDIARAMFNPDADWNEVDADLDRRYVEHERKMEQYRKNMVEYERRSAERGETDDKLHL